jgi:YHS domain-containing protein
MDELSEFEGKIQQRLAAARERRLAKQATVRNNMEEHEQSKAKFAEIAQRIMRDIIRPRMQKLASLFPNSHLSDKDESIACGVICKFDRTPEYPAGTKLDIGISAESTVNNAILTYDLEILPIFFQFEGHHQLVVPLDATDDRTVASWLDGKLLGFTDTYLQLQVVDQYQQSNMVVDPVCGMRINQTSAAATAEYEGRTYYFCVEQCREKFLSEPERYSTRRVS